MSNCLIHKFDKLFTGFLAGYIETPMHQCIRCGQFQAWFGYLEEPGWTDIEIGKFEFWDMERSSSNRNV